MALLKRSDFAAKCQISPQYLAQYINRGKVVVNNNDLIDDSNELNESFFQTRITNVLSMEEVFEELTRELSGKPYNHTAEKKMVDLINAEKAKGLDYPLIPTELLYNIICDQLTTAYEFMMKTEAKHIIAQGSVKKQYLSQLKEFYEQKCRDQIKAFKQEVDQIVSDIVNDYPPVKNGKSKGKIMKVLNGAGDKSALIGKKSGKNQLTNTNSKKK